VPYKVKGKCVYKKDTGEKVGCTDGSIKDYLAALHARADESIRIDKEELKKIIKEEIQIVRYMLEKKGDNPRWRLWDDPDWQEDTEAPKAKARATTKRKAKRKKRKCPKGQERHEGKCVTIPKIVLPNTYTERSKQLNRQLQYLYTRKNRAGIHENFIIIDDVRHLLYVHEPNHFKILKTFPVITGESPGETRPLEFTDWLKKEGRWDRYSELSQKAWEHKRSAEQLKASGGKQAKSQAALAMKEHEKFKQLSHKFFVDYLAWTKKMNLKITPSGVFTIESALDPHWNKFYYGIGILRIGPGIDDAGDRKNPGWIAIHGTGNPGRIKALKAAQKYVDRGIYNIAPIVIKKPSYGCVNLLDKNIKILSGLIRPGSQVFILPEDGTIVKVGDFKTFTEKIWDWRVIKDRCVDKISDFFGFD
jgi:hypothetical protein